MFGRARIMLALSFAAVLVVVQGFIGATAYVRLRSSLNSEIDNSLHQAHDSLLASGEGRGWATTPVATGAQNGEREHDDEDDDEEDDLGGNGQSALTLGSDVFFVVTAPSGLVLANPRRVDVDGVNFAALAAGAGSETRHVDVAAEEHYRILTSYDRAGGVYLNVGRSLDARDSQLRTLLNVMVAGALAGLVLSIAGGWWLAGRALVPIEQALDSQRRFVSDASHELRTPLSVIQANAELLLRHPDSTIESSIEQVAAVTSAGEQMTSLVGDLLTLARADEGRLQLAAERLDLADIAAEVVRDMAAVAEAKGVRLEVRAGRAPVTGDRLRLRQLAVILADNAIKYTPPGGSVTLVSRRDGRSSELTVRDTGPGIPAEEQRHIFDRFYRADPSRARGSGGAGLGLAIAKSLAEAHGGRISVESDLRDGATFRVRLPSG